MSYREENGEVVQRITYQDLENSITQAQYTVCVQHLRDMKCPICSTRKGYCQAFCKACYFALPAEMRAPLWIERTTPDDLRKFVKAYLDAKDFLRGIGRAEVICA
jgi:hypothetical protein